MNLTKPKLLKKDWPVLIFDIPDPIWQEIEEIEEEGRRYKDHPLSYLKAHYNAGYGRNKNEIGNDYQCNIPLYLIQKSFWFPWVLKVAEEYSKYLNFNITNESSKGRNVVMSSRYNMQHHTDEFYDVWLNFAYKGNKNFPHYHPYADIAGVVYCKNKSLEPTYFYKTKIDYTGKPVVVDSSKYRGREKTMVLFPANLWHEVKEKKDDDERITLAFNLNFLDHSGVQRIAT